MLIIGDIASNTVNKDHPIHQKEIIFQDASEKRYLEKHFLDENYVKTVEGDYTTVYDHAEEKDTVILYDININAGVKYLVKKNSATLYNFKVASPIVNFWFDIARLKANYGVDNGNNWINRIRSYHYYLHNYIYPLAYHNPKLFDDYRKKSSILSGFIENSVHLEDNHVSEHYDDIYTKKNILRLLYARRKEFRGSPLKKVTFSDKNLETVSAHVFYRMGKTDQVKTLVDLIYVHTCEEYALPYQLLTNSFPTWSQFYNNMFNVMMLLASENRNPCLIDFMIANFFEISVHFTEDRYNNFITNCNNKCLKS